MEPKTLRDMDAGDTLLLASEIQERTIVSQVYEKVDDTSVKHVENDSVRQLPSDELVYPFEPGYAAKLS
jgi:hypothetical protein